MSCGRIESTPAPSTAYDSSVIKTGFLRVYIPEAEATYSVMQLPAAIGQPWRVRVGRFGLIGESLRNDAFVIEHGGETFICPRRPHLRMLEGVLAFRNAFIDAGGGLVVPETTALLAAEELSRLKDREPEQRSHILTSAWFIPLRWFAAFDPSERSYDTDPPGVVLRTPVYRAIQRLRAALRVLTSVNMDDSVIEELSELVEWLNGFTGHGLLELDYGTLVDMFEPWELVDEDTVEHVHRSLDALRDGDMEEAGRNYQRAVEPWAHWMFLTSAN